MVILNRYSPGALHGLFDVSANEHQLPAAPQVFPPEFDRNHHLVHGRNSQTNEQPAIAHVRLFFAHVYKGIKESQFVVNTYASQWARLSATKHLSLVELWL